MKVVDFIFYYIFQASRKNKKEKHHQNLAVGMTATIIFGFLIFSVIFIIPKNYHPFGLPKDITVDFILFLSVVIGFLLYKRYQRINKDNLLVTAYDQKYPFRKWNKNWDPLIMFISFWVLMAMAVLFGTLVRKIFIWIFYIG